MKRNSPAKRYIVAIICLFILISLPSKYTNSLRRSLLDLFTFPLKITTRLVNFFIHHSDYKRLITENKLLSQKNMELSLENSNLNYLRQENENLRFMLDFKKRLPYESLPAEVIGLDYTANRRIIFLDRGSEGKVFENMVCLNSDGLIGKVIEAGNNISKVICLNDPNSRIPAKLENTQEQGLVYGTIRGDFLQMRYLSRDTKAEVGNLVVTSGLGSIYPRGIRIGKISEVKTEGFYKTAIVAPAVDFLRLEEVLLIKK